MADSRTKNLRNRQSAITIKKKYINNVMDQLKLNIKTLYSFLFFIGLALLLAGWSIGYSGDTQYITKDSATLKVVKKGEIYTKITGTGKIHPKNKRIISSKSTGNVEEIFQKAGATVEPDTLIARLSNPLLESKMKEALFELKNETIKKRKLILKQKKELIELATDISQNKVDLEIATLQWDAEEKLLNAGIISKVSYQKTALNIKKLEQKQKSLNRKQITLKAAHQESISIQNDIIAHYQSKYKDAQVQFESLNIKANYRGLLQQLNINLGQQVKTGEMLAVVSKPDDLLARIKIPQIHAHLLKIGMKVQLSSYQHQGLGVITQMDPAIHEGAMNISVDIEPNEHFYPMQNVDAVIHANKQAGITYLQQHGNFNVTKPQWVFKLTSAFAAEKQRVIFGKSYDGKVQILEGLKPGDKILFTNAAIPERVRHLILNNP